jgi:hypothetical protein
MVPVPNGNTDSEEPFTNIPHLHVEPLPEADGVEHVIAAGQLRLRHVLHHIMFMVITNSVADPGCLSRIPEPHITSHHVHGYLFSALRIQITSVPDPDPYLDMDP